MTDKPISYWMAVARMGFEDDFNRLFEDLGISRSDLADRLGVSPAYISKVLNGTAGNYKLETMAKWARAIGAILQIRLIKEEGEVVRVVDYETAGALDDRRMATGPGAGHQPAAQIELASVVNLADYARTTGKRAETRAVSQEKSISVSELDFAEECHG